MTDGSLKRKIGAVDIVALGVGAAVGVSIFVALGPATRLAGPGVLIAMIVAVAPMALFGLIYAFLGSSVPATGASYVWARSYVHPFAAFMVAWLRIAGSTAAMIVLARALVQYLGAAAPISSPMPVIATAFLTVWALNTIGVSIAARAQLLMVIVLLGALGVLVGSAVPRVAAAHFAPVMSHGLGGVLAAVPMLAGLFFGVEAATEMGEEARARSASVPVAIMIALAVTAAIYIAAAVSVLGVLGPDFLSVSPAALLDLAQRTLGAAGAPLIATAAAAAIGAAMNALFMILSRSLMAMGRTGVLPSVFAAVHPRSGTPWVAATVALGLCLVGMLLPASLVFLFITVNIPNLLKYGVTSVAAARAIDIDPAICERTAVRLPRRWMRVLCWAGAATALALIALGWDADWRPYATLGAWAAIGAGYFLLRYAWFRGKP